MKPSPFISILPDMLPLQNCKCIYKLMFSKLKHVNLSLHTVRINNSGFKDLLLLHAQHTMAVTRLAHHV